MMKKYFFLLIALLGTFTFSNAQNVKDTLIVVPGKQGMYFYHVVTNEETLYSLSRRYHVDPKELADFNHLTLKSQLQLFQIVKIPLNNENLDQSSTTNAAGLSPLYHKVLKGETLYHISQLYDKVPDALLQKWNGLTGNEVKTGQYFIIGWLKSGDGNVPGATNKLATRSVQSLSNAQSVSPVRTEDTIQPEKEKIEQNNTVNTDNPNNNNNNQPDKSGASNNNGNSNNAFLNEVIASENASRNIHNSSAPVDADNDAFAVSLNKPKTTVIKNLPGKPEKPKEEIMPVPEKKEPVKRDKVILQLEKPEKPDSFDIMLNRVTQVSKNNAAPGPVPQAVVQKTQPDPDTQASQPSSNTDNAVVTEPVTAVASEFGQQYEQQTSNETNVSSKKGAAGWFKSNVKPGSGRYYALCNDLPRGTIVKVINPLNEKSILVKVLDVIPKGAENYNLIIKISDAAMSDLDVTQSRFWCEIQYPNQ